MTSPTVDGRDVESQVAAQLDYLSRLAGHLGIADPVEEYFAPVVGRWSDMHAEADRWRLVGASVEQVTETLGAPLGKLDAAWDGAAAESFITYMQRVGLAGNDLADAMVAMAEVLDQTANGIREIVQELAGILAETAEIASEAMALPVQGDVRAREYLDMMRRPTKELFESVRQILEAFAQLCEGGDADELFRQVTMNHRFPEENWSAPAVPSPSTGIPTPSAPPVDTSTDLAGAPARADLAGAGIGGGFGGGGGAGLASGAAAAGAAPPLGPGNYTVTGEQAPRGNAPAAAAAAPSGGGPKSGAGGMGMMPPMMPMGGQGQGGDADHKNRSRVVGNPTDIFGKPPKASTPVIGADD